MKSRHTWSLRKMSRALKYTENGEMICTGERRDNNQVALVRAGK